MWNCISEVTGSELNFSAFWLFQLVSNNTCARISCYINPLMRKRQALIHCQHSLSYSLTGANLARNVSLNKDHITVTRLDSTTPTVSHPFLFLNLWYDNYTFFVQTLLCMRPILAPDGAERGWSDAYDGKKSCSDLMHGQSATAPSLHASVYIYILEACRACLGQANDYCICWR